MQLLEVGEQVGFVLPRLNSVMRVAARARGLDDVRAEEPGAAEDQDVEFRRLARGERGARQRRRDAAASAGG